MVILTFEGGLMTLNDAIVKRITALCEENNITLNKLSTICGMTQSTLNNIICGNSKRPMVSTIKKICDGLDITLSDFFDTEYFKDLEQEIQ